MSEKFKEKVGEEIYNKIIEAGLKPEEFDLINDGAYIPRARLNEVTGKLKATEEKVTSHEKQLEETKKLLEGNDELKVKHEALNTKYLEDLASKDKEIINTSKKFLVEQHLRESGAKHTSLLMREIDLDSLSMDNDRLLGLDKATEKLKTDYSDLFVTKETKNNSKQSDDNGSGDNNGSGDDDDDWDELMKDF